MNFRAAFATAANRWNFGLYNFRFDIVQKGSKSCDEISFPVNEISNFAWFDNVSYCGTSWNPREYAYTISDVARNGDKARANIIFNTKHHIWAIYDGPWLGAQSGGRPDFTRVAAHELGHVAGLGHPQNRSSIMFENPTDVVRPTPSDQNVLNTNYATAAVVPQSGWACNGKIPERAWSIEKPIRSLTYINMCFDDTRKITDIIFFLEESRNYKFYVGSNRSETNANLVSNGRLIWRDENTLSKRKSWSGYLQGGFYTINLYQEIIGTDLVLQIEPN